MTDVTQLLHNWYGGDRDALNEIFPMVYEEMKRVAKGKLRDWPNRPFEPTLLVHEAYMRLQGISELQIESRTHFLHLAGSLIHRILVDQARHGKRQKRGGDQHLVTIQEALISGSENVDLLALNQGIEELEKVDWRQARIVEWKVFAGLSTQEMADTLNVSERTIKREWRMARAYLARFLSDKKDQA